jgi:hypothetical protein
MTQEEIKTLVEQEAEKYFKEAKTTFATEALKELAIKDWCDGYTFYEQTVLPKILEEAINHSGQLTDAYGTFSKSRFDEWFKGLKSTTQTEGK